VLLALRNNRHVVTLPDYLVGHHLHFFVYFIKPAPHEALNRVNGVFRIGDRLALGHLADQPFAALGKRDNRGRRPSALFVLNNFGLSAFHDRDHGVRGSHVNSYNLTHGTCLLAYKWLKIKVYSYNRKSISVFECVIVKY